MEGDLAAVVLTRLLIGGSLDDVGDVDGDIAGVTTAGPGLMAGAGLVSTGLGGELRSGITPGVETGAVFT